ncbi:MAG: hypothetical protein U0269_12980 [Polyangiales bacterium]
MAAEQTLDELVASIRWLTPDAALDRLSDDAVFAIRSAADELTGIWQEHVGTSVELPLLEPYITRSADDALQRWTSNCIDPEPTNAAAQRQQHESAWMQAHRAVLARRINAELTASDARGVIGRFRSHINKLEIALPPSWSPAWSALLPGLCAAYRHWWCGAKFARADKPLPSPWAPLVALWARGCWPVLSPNGELIVWVPTRRSGTIVIDADTSAARAKNVNVSRLFGGEHFPPGRLPVCLTAVAGRITVSPLSEKNVLHLQDGTISAGTASTNQGGTIVRSSVEGQVDRYDVRVEPNFMLSVDGEPAREFVLAPGTEVSFERGEQSVTHYFLGAPAGSSCEQPQYNAADWTR